MEYKGMPRGLTSDVRSKMVSKKRKVNTTTARQHNDGRDENGKRRQVAWVNLYKTTVTYLLLLPQKNTCRTHSCPNTHGRNEDLQTKMLGEPIPNSYMTTFPRRRRNSFSPVTICLAPVQRNTSNISPPCERKCKFDLSNGCPNAMAPPFTFTYIIFRHVPHPEIKYIPCP